MDDIDDILDKLEQDEEKTQSQDICAHKLHTLDAGRDEITQHGVNDIKQNGDDHDAYTTALLDVCQRSPISLHVDHSKPLTVELLDDVPMTVATTDPMEASAPTVVFDSIPTESLIPLITAVPVEDVSVQIPQQDGDISGSTTPQLTEMANAATELIEQESPASDRSICDSIGALDIPVTELAEKSPVNLDLLDSGVISPYSGLDFISSVADEAAVQTASRLPDREDELESNLMELESVSSIKTAPRDFSLVADTMPPTLSLSDPSQYISLVTEDSTRPLSDPIRPGEGSAATVSEPVVSYTDGHSMTRSVPVSIPARSVIGFQPATWDNVDDVSDGELEEFLRTLGETEGTSLSAELELIPADNFSVLSGEVAVVETGGDTGGEALPWTEEDLAELRASPPLEMAPPIPMTLVDVTEFMDQESLIPSASVHDTSSQLDFTLTGEPVTLSAQNDDSGGDSEHTSTSDEAVIQLSTDGSQDTDPGPSDYLIAVDDAGDGAGEDESFRSASASFTGDENAVPQHPVIFSADNLGKIKPEWVPDDFAPICMLCGVRFSMVKRRHHCRACGSVICASCGNYRAKLEYLEMREDRVCALCNETFQYRNGGGQTERQDGDGRATDAMRSPSPVVVSAFIGPQPPGVLRRQDDPRRERRNVVFFDGIRPGGDLQEPESHGDGRRLAVMNAKRQRRSPGAPPEAPPTPKSRSTPKKSSANHVVRLFVNRDVLPVMEMTKDGHYVLHENPDLPGLLEKFTVCPSEPVDFYVNLCLRITVQLLDLKCCMNETVWSFITSGMRLVGQDELIILLVKQEDDPLPPRDVFLHLNEIFLHAKQGHVIGNLGHSVVSLGGFDLGFLGNRNNAGFLFIRQTFQCVSSLKLPEPPYLFGILMSKWEIPWAKMFPLRLMLRLGIEYRYYPCPLISFRNRKPVFEEVGHTVMNLLCDFRNFQYHLPCVEDTECCMEKGIITVRIPRHRYDQIVKICQGSNEHVLALGLGFSRRADAHLVCVQNFENGQYETQAINIESKGRKVTGTSFIIFNASLKGTEALECRAAVVEDGVMAQINLRGLEELKLALKSMRNITFKAIRKTDDVTAPVEQETILIEWTTDGKTCNSGVKSPIDGKDMVGIESRRVALKHSMDFLNGTLSVRCTEVFLTDDKDTGMVYREEIDVSRLAENLAMASCSVLRTHLYDYRDAGTTKIAVRVTLGPDTVEYEVGARNERFSPQALTEFDDKIMPLIYECARVWGVRPRLEMELIFRIFQH